MVVYFSEEEKCYVAKTTKLKVDIVAKGTTLKDAREKLMRKIEKTFRLIS